MQLQCPRFPPTAQKTREGPSVSLTGVCDRHNRLLLGQAHLPPVEERNAHLPGPEPLCGPAVACGVEGAREA